MLSRIHRRSPVFVTVAFCAAVLMPLVGCLAPRVTVVGDTSVVDAKIFIDGKKVGSAEKEINSETKNIFAYVEVSGILGWHDLKIVSKSGQSLEKRVDFSGENYVNVSFNDGYIEFESD